MRCDKNPQNVSIKIDKMSLRTEDEFSVLFIAFDLEGTYN
jgi:hypothetical protein